MKMKKLSKAGLLTAMPFLFLLLSVAGVSAQTAEDAAAIDSFQLYYGGDKKVVTSVIDNIQENQLVVVDVRSLTETQLDKLKQSSEKVKATLIAYLSIGELHSREMVLFKTFAESKSKGLDFEKLKSDVFIGDNSVFSSHHVDVANQMWRDFVLAKAKKILANGIDGLFLDTVDTADIYALKKDWDAEHRARSVTAMVSLIREIKKQNDGCFTLQNRGLNLIGKEVFVAESNGVTPGVSLAEPHEHNPDVVLFENAFNSTNEWATQVVKKLDAIQQSGESVVVALGYSDIIKDQAEFQEQCEQYKFVPSWASNSESLHLEVARWESSN